MEDRYIASLVLGGVGDALGYHGGQWEFCFSGKLIHEELDRMGGLEKLVISGETWKVSDDTVMHLATAEALIEASDGGDSEKMYLSLAKHYKECMKDMTGRAPGGMCKSSTGLLRPLVSKGYIIPFNPRGGGCGASMRAMAIGLRYSRPEELDQLISVSIEAGRMTHNVPVGYLGSLAAGLFTCYAIQGLPVYKWGAALMSLKDRALQYVVSQGRDVQENKDHWTYFWDAWSKYLSLRKLENGSAPAVFPERYGIKERDTFYKSVSYSGWGGSSGHDSVIIAYDALLGCGGSWLELCRRGMLHGGDSDSTGSIAGSWFGALYGFQGVPDEHFKNLEYRSRLEILAKKLLEIAGWSNKIATISPAADNFPTKQASPLTDESHATKLSPTTDLPQSESPIADTSVVSQHC